MVDSKKITKEEQREALYEEIMKLYHESNDNASDNATMEWAVCVMDAAKIDEAAEIAEQRKAIITKLNTVAMTDKMYFDFGADGKPKMAA